MKFGLAVLAIVEAILLGPLLASDSDSDVEAEQVFGAFEFFCLEQLRSQERIPQLLKNVGAIELPADQAATFLTPQSGRAWMIRPAGEAIDPFVIALADTTACTVMAPKAKGARVLALFQEYTRNAKIQEKRIGSQIEYGFAVSHDDQFRDGDAHAVVLISTTQLFGGEGVILSAVSEAMLPKTGIEAPTWPK